ncbi:hypothetical protein HYS54_01895 [Candidatus Micrarchaeota archaeon]|nr:hypothetical protein [Candidatus Micrarchaeota archaeon]
MLVSNGGAVRLVLNSGETLFLDATFRCRSGIAGVSHGHSDHLRKHSTQTIATNQTALLFPSYFNNPGLEYGQQLKIGDALVSLHDAGHVLGSAQFRIEEDDNVVVYTGDMKASPSFLFGGAEQPECDTLVIDSTFGSPEYSFPPASDVAESIKSWVSTHSDSNVVFGAYPLGKTQELVSILNGIGVQPIISRRASHFSHVCDWSGLRQEFLESGTPEAELSRAHACVEIVSPSLLQRSAAITRSENGKRTLTALATGWAGSPLASGCDRAFPLSGHSDFSELLEYAASSGAKRVLTVHGFDRELAAHLRKRGINARPLHLAGGAQARISDW